MEAEITVEVFSPLPALRERGWGWADEKQSRFHDLWRFGLLKTVALTSALSLKGWNKAAQGNALGRSAQIGSSPERAVQPVGTSVVAPLQGKKTDQRPAPRALPWAFLFWPLRGIGPAGRLRRLKNRMKPFEDFHQPTLRVSDSPYIPMR